MRRNLGALLFSLAMAHSVSPALAHAQLVTALPAPDGVIATSPTEVRLSFSEEIEPRFSGFEVFDSDGRGLSAGEITVDGKAMAAPLSETPAPGEYRVDWHVLSADGHSIEGSYTFEVRP